jgi:hypothetical protein
MPPMPLVTKKLKIAIMLCFGIAPVLGLWAAESQVAQSQIAQSQVSVQVNSGRRFVGIVEPDSDAEYLILRMETNGLTLRRSIRRASILAVAPITEINSPPAAARMIEMRGPAETLPAAATATAPAPIQPVRQAARVSFDSLVANWDADVETDGLVLDLAPLDAAGYLVPAGGTLQVELFAPERRVFHHAPLSGGDTLELVERWTTAITASDFGSAGLRVRLPFGAVHPEIDTDWLASWYGLVHVQLALPGHGVFEDSRDGVRIRPWAPNRDNLEMNTGRRFLPTERLGRRD